MELNEEKLLSEIIGEFSAAIQTFTEKNFEKAMGAFEAIGEKYKDSDSYSVLEIQARAKVYRNICFSQLNPYEVKLETDEDHLNEGIFSLNAGNYDRALDLLGALNEKGFQGTYVRYLLGLLHWKKEEAELSAKFLVDAIREDEFYKILIHNEPDFEGLAENEAMAEVVELISGGEPQQEG